MHKILFYFTCFISSFGFTATYTYNCSIADSMGGGRATPCVCPAPKMINPFCPRLEGIKLPCIGKVIPGSCEYTVVDPPVCVTPKYCDAHRNTSVCKAPLVDYECGYFRQGACKAPEVSFDCGTFSQGACKAPEVSYECGSYVQGACNSRDERGVCTGYEQVFKSVTCQRCDAGYEQIHHPATCTRCEAGYEQIQVSVTCHRCDAGYVQESYQYVCGCLDP